MIGAAMSELRGGSSSSGPGWRTPAVIVVCGCLIALINFGVRASFGLFTGADLRRQRLGPRRVRSRPGHTELAVGGGAAFRRRHGRPLGPARVLAGGGLIYALGVALMPVSTTPLLLNLTAGVLVGLGLAGASFIVVISALGKLLPLERRSWAAGSPPPPAHWGSSFRADRARRSSPASAGRQRWSCSPPSRC